MYDCYQDKITDGNESFSMLGIIFENLLFISIWTCMGFLLWPIWIVSGIPILTAIWAIIVIYIQIILKKHNCSGCYYYDKLCHLGWGKISSALFKQDSGNPETGKKLTLFYIISPPIVFIASLIFALLNNVSPIYCYILLVFIILNIITLPVRKYGCGACKMREVCPGSAVPKK